jgi:hypothetical protein
MTTNCPAVVEYPSLAWKSGLLLYFFLPDYRTTSGRSKQQYDTQTIKITAIIARGNNNPNRLQLVA